MQFVYQPVSLSLSTFKNTTNRPVVVINVFVGATVGITSSQMPAIYDKFGNLVGWALTLVYSSNTATYGAVVSFQPFVLQPGWYVQVSGVPLGVQAVILDDINELRGVL